MSAVIKTTTPFMVQEALFKALYVLGYAPKLSHGDIVTNRVDYNGNQCFECIKNHWVLRHDRDEHFARVLSGKQYINVSSFLQQVEAEYLAQYELYLAEQAEIERQRLEAERKARVEAARQQAITQAKAQGYRVQEKRLNGKIQLVCTRSV